jgi:hypothetical protein
VRIEAVDPRDTRWEENGPHYRVYFWDGPRHTSAEYEIAEADVAEVLAWADREARSSGRTFTLFVQHRCGDDDPGLIRLAGWEGSSTDWCRPSHAVDMP